MKRLIAFGCSAVFGYYLPDEFGKPTSPYGPPSKFAWPTLLANKLGYSDCFNEAQCGASNIEILKKIIEFPYRDNDVVVVLWAFLERETIFHPDKDKIYRIGTSKKDFSNWLRLHHTYDLAVKKCINMHHAMTFLEHKKLSYLFYSVDEDLSGNPGLYDQYGLKINNLNFHQIVEANPKALDGRHPGLEAHAIMADKIYTHLIEHKTP